jgi:hypothetical protein
MTGAQPTGCHMDENAEKLDLHLIEFTISVGHTISTGVPFENIKIGAELKCAVRRGTTNEQFKVLLEQAETRLKEIAVETYKAQKRPKPIEPTQTTKG